MKLEATSQKRLREFNRARDDHAYAHTYTHTLYRLSGLVRYFEAKTVDLLLGGPMQAPQNDWDDRAGLRGHG